MRYMADMQAKPVLEARWIFVDGRAKQLHESLGIVGVDTHGFLR
jgi:hypothetical protein